MFDHVGLWVPDLADATRFYTLLMGRDPAYTSDTIVEWNDLALGQANPNRPVTRGVHLALGAASREEVDARWQATVDAGYEADGEPGPRLHYGPTYYGGFVRDPGGNSAEVVHREQVRQDGDIDHIWLRVADVRASLRFYDTIADAAGLRRVEHVPGEFVHYTSARTGRPNLRLLAGAPVTEPVHIAFEADGTGPVEAFHVAAVGAGYTDNGGPGERPEYHAGYYGAFVLDPDGHNIEVVFHEYEAP